MSTRDKPFILFIHWGTDNPPPHSMQYPGIVLASSSSASAVNYSVIWDLFAVTRDENNRLCHAVFATDIFPSLLSFGRDFYPISWAERAHKNTYTQTWKEGGQLCGPKDWIPWRIRQLSWPLVYISCVYIRNSYVRETQSNCQPQDYFLSTTIYPFKRMDEVKLL